MTEENDQLFAPYNTTWNPAEKKGYSGTLMLAKDETVPMKKEMWIERFDHEWRSIQAEFQKLKTDVISLHSQRITVAASIFLLVD